MIYDEVKIDVHGYYGKAKLQIWSLGNYQEMRPNQRRPIVIICPGGAYEFVSEKEGEPLAVRFLSMGVHVALLTYVVHPIVHYPDALVNLAGAVKYLKWNADKYFIDPDKIIIQGSSAGGHLAACFGCFWHEQWLNDELFIPQGSIRPAGLILNYPVITSGEKAHHESFHNLLGDLYDEVHDYLSLEKRVTKLVPRTFLWHTVTDDLVPVENSLLFAEALIKHGVSVELHLYPVGGHGLALANYETQNADGYGIQKEVQSWPDLAKTWLSYYNDYEE